MKNKIIFPMILNLQLFGEGTGGGDGGTGAEGAKGATATAAVSQKKGVNNPLADVKYGIQPTEEATPAAEVNPTPTEDRNAKFEALIKGEFKDLYDARMQDTIQKRLKGQKETVDKYNALAPTLETLAKKYGVDPADIEALNKAIEEDDSFFEEEALNRGLSVEQYKEIRKMERENAQLRAQFQEQDRRDEFIRKVTIAEEQAKVAKQTYPSLDLRHELNNNPDFYDLVMNRGIDVGNAYLITHKDDIIPAAMQFTAKTVEQKFTNKVIANGARPVENGNSSQSASVVKSDVSQLSRADRDEIRRRVARGEKISF